MIPNGIRQNDISYDADLPFDLAHGSERTNGGFLPPDPDPHLRLLQITANLYAKEAAVLTLVLNDKKFHKDPHTYLRIWGTLQKHHTIAAKNVWEHLKIRINTPPSWPQRHEMRAAAIIERIENSAEYKNNPQAYMKVWIDARSGDNGRFPEEDKALEHFRKLWYIEDDLRYSSKT